MVVRRGREWCVRGAVAMAGWAPFLEDSLLGVGLSAGAILSHGGETLVASPGFRVSREQALRLGAALRGHGSAEAEVRSGGFAVGGAKYALTRLESDENVDVKFLIGRGKVKGQPVRGVIVAQSYQALIFAVHDPLHCPELSFGRANVAVTVLAEALMAQEY